MLNAKKGLCWAAAILLTAIAKKFGVFNADAVDTLLLVLPILAVQSFMNVRECRLFGKRDA